MKVEQKSDVQLPVHHCGEGVFGGADVVKNLDELRCARRLVVEVRFEDFGERCVGPFECRGALGLPPQGGSPKQARIGYLLASLVEPSQGVHGFGDECPRRRCELYGLGERRGDEGPVLVVLPEPRIMPTDLHEPPDRAGPETVGEHDLKYNSQLLYIEAANVKPADTPGRRLIANPLEH